MQEKQLTPLEKLEREYNLGIIKYSEYKEQKAKLVPPPPKVKGSRCAFPIIATYKGVEFVEYGLTKREYFAAKAMQGIMADPESVGTFESIAKRSVDIADALIKALNENPANE